MINHDRPARRHPFHCERCIVAFFVRRIGFAIAATCFVLAILLWSQCHQSTLAGENMGRPNAEGSVAYVLEHHDCRSYGGQLPGHVIASYGSGGYRYLSEKGVHDAYEQLTHDGVFEANAWTRPIDHDMHVIKFCA